MMPRAMIEETECGQATETLILDPSGAERRAETDPVYSKTLASVRKKNLKKEEISGGSRAPVGTYLLTL